MKCYDNWVKSDKPEAESTGVDGLGNHGLNAAFFHQALPKLRGVACSSFGYTQCRGDHTTSTYPKKR